MGFEFDGNISSQVFDDLLDIILKNYPSLVASQSLTKW
jgi:hypothetical protein